MAGSEHFAMLHRSALRRDYRALQSATSMMASAVSSRGLVTWQPLVSDFQTAMRLGRKLEEEFSDVHSGILAEEEPDYLQDLTRVDIAQFYVVANAMLRGQYVCES